MCNLCTIGAKPNACPSDATKCYNTDMCGDCTTGTPLKCSFAEICYTDSTTMCTQCTAGAKTNACPEPYFSAYAFKCYASNPTLCTDCTGTAKPNQCPTAGDKDTCYANGENHCEKCPTTITANKLVKCPLTGDANFCYTASTNHCTVCPSTATANKVNQCPNVADVLTCYSNSETHCAICPFTLNAGKINLCPEAADSAVCYLNSETPAIACPASTPAPAPATCSSGQFSCKGVCKIVGAALYCADIDQCIEGEKLFSKATGNVLNETIAANLKCPCTGFYPIGSNPNIYFDNPLVAYIAGTCRTPPPDQSTAGPNEIICPNDAVPGTYVTRLKENTIYCPDTGKCFFINDAIYCPDLVGGARCVYSAEYLSENWQNLTYNQIICPCKDPKYMWIDFYGDMKCVEFVNDSNGIPKPLCDNTKDPKEIKCSTNGNCVVINYFTELCPGVIDCGSLTVGSFLVHIIQVSHIRHRLTFETIDGA